MKIIKVAAASALLVTSPLSAYRCLPYAVSQSPYATYIAQEVGDLVTVIVKEEAKTSDDGTGELKRKSSVSALLNQLFLPPFDFQKGLTRAAGGGDPLEIDLQSNSTFTSNAINKVNHSFETEIQVRLIEEVRPQEFVIRGHRFVNINGKPKKIYISGVIRQRDIDAGNTISSTRVADATIEIEGEVGSEDLKPGIFTRMFNKVF